MDLTAWLLRHTPPCPLLVTAPGGTAVRLAVERAARVRGWKQATHPAEANILVLAGPPGSGVEPYAQRLWNVLPAPRARADIPTPAGAAEALDAAAATLRDTTIQRARAARPAGHADTRASHAGEDIADAAHEPSPEHNRHEHAGHHEHGAPHEPGDNPGRHDQHGGQQHRDHHHDGQQRSDHRDHDAGSHAAHDPHAHHGHQPSGMDLPGGIPMAERAQDRDGLILDRLTVPLGPALPDWPAGLILHTTMQGDILQTVRVELLPAGRQRSTAGEHDPGPGSSAANVASELIIHRLDRCARLLGPAGWDDAAMRARRLRDEVLHGTEAAELRGPLRKWARTVRRSRILRWLLAGVGDVPEGPSTPPQLVGDALARLHRWLDTAVAASAHLDHPEPELSPGPELLPEFETARLGTARFASATEARWVVDALPVLLEGTELATARLVVASLAPDTDVLTGGDPVTPGAADG